MRKSEEQVYDFVKKGGGGEADFISYHSLDKNWEIVCRIMLDAASSGRNHTSM